MVVRACAAFAIALQACGTGASVIAADASAHDAAGFDASDGAAALDAACPDGGFITIEGDGVEQTLASNAVPPVMYFTIPMTPWAQAYDVQGLVIGGSQNEDGGASLRFDVEIQESAVNGPFAILEQGTTYSYAYYTRQDGVLFSPTSPVAASITLTHVDPPGGLVAGSYTATVANDAGSLSLSGTFATCRLLDFVGPIPPNP